MREGETMVALPQVAADEIGLRADLLERAYDLLHKGTEGSSRKFPGAALLVGRRFARMLSV